MQQWTACEWEILQLLVAQRERFFKKGFEQTWTAKICCGNMS
jgi:hypothetical protein